jgi:TonB family protein
MAPRNNESVEKNREFFQSVGEGTAPKGALSASIVIHGVGLLFLIVLPLLAPQTLRLRYQTTMLAPPPQPAKPQPEPLRLEMKLPPRPLAKAIAPPPPEHLVEPPPPLPAPKTVAPEPEIRTRIKEAVAQVAPAPLVASVAPALPAPKSMPAVAPAQPPVVTNVFSNTAPAALAAVAVRNPEVSGFGDASPAREVRNAGKGGGTALAGFGEVKGTREGAPGGVKGGIGTVSGFDSGAGVPGGVPGGSGRGTVAVAGFAAAADAPRVVSTPKAQEPVKNEKPVEIVQKPRPDYTDEARKMRIEGEVLLRVLFSASGEVRVLDVVRGLGYGLNENAIRSALQIRFKPAERGGQPVDSTATVHIVFQLAY